MSTFFPHICLSPLCCAIKMQFLTKVDRHFVLKISFLFVPCAFLVYLLKLSSTQLCLFSNNIMLTISYMFHHKRPIIRLYMKIWEVKYVFFTNVSWENVEFLIVILKKTCLLNLVSWMNESSSLMMKNKRITTWFNTQHIIFNLPYTSSTLLTKEKQETGYK